MNTMQSPASKYGKYLFIALAFLLIVASSCGTLRKKSDKNAVTENSEVVQSSTSEIEGEIYDRYDEPPQFPGGYSALGKFLSDNIRYPVEACDKGIQGRVICRFVVAKDGSLSGFEIMRGVDPLLDNEAIRVLRLMPNFTPAKLDGKAVNGYTSIPVVFILNKGEAEKE
ncbi:energy transducer TonB [Proteiniphilum sp.]|uniref:energy transducer TonB n=1 Tax=Proteiniphilum sp. TaxID=1926877 RepID=UPI002B209168|nr:energy transducer TonB [Proteiniphilum sp.]MEA4918633.1 energy transducer TonB [Proteiniphilum sp.]